MINYTDYIGLMMSSVSTIINAISYVLIAFVAISLVVSSIMIGIITYISVLERTKEIGILRSIGASKHDISMVFNAETLIVGFVSGAMGIIVTLLLIIPINAVIKNLSGISNVAGLPWVAALILVLISMALTFINAYYLSFSAGLVICRAMNTTAVKGLYFTTDTKSETKLLINSSTEGLWGMELGNKYYWSNNGDNIFDDFIVVLTNMTNEDGAYHEGSERELERF